MANKRYRKKQSLYEGKDYQFTVYVTEEADKKLRQAMVRAAPPGKSLTAADVVTYCLLAAADGMTRETVADVAETSEVTA